MKVQVLNVLYLFSASFLLPLVPAPAQTITYEVTGNLGLFNGTDDLNLGNATVTARITAATNVQPIDASGLAGVQTYANYPTLSTTILLSRPAQFVQIVSDLVSTIALTDSVNPTGLLPFDYFEITPAAPVALPGGGTLTFQIIAEFPKSFYETRPTRVADGVSVPQLPQFELSDTGSFFFVVNGPLSGYSVTNGVLTIVPEPTSAALFAFAAMIFSCHRASRLDTVNDYDALIDRLKSGEADLAASGIHHIVIDPSPGYPVMYTSVRDFIEQLPRS